MRGDLKGASHHQQISFRRKPDVIGLAGGLDVVHIGGNKKTRQVLGGHRHLAGSMGIGGGGGVAEILVELVPDEVHRGFELIVVFPDNGMEQFKGLGLIILGGAHQA